MKSMKVKRYLQGLLLIICLLVTSCAQIIAVNADEQDVSLEITLEDESTPIEDPTGRIGMMMITAGVGLMAIAIVLIVRRELKK